MNVFEFEKSLLTRLEESCNVLQCKDSPVSALDVRDEWACHVELKIEPAGWQAIWKISRATCEQLNIKYPTVVYGTVNNVYFQDLKADFSVIAVQDDDVHIPEVHEVPLEDLWPTTEQENTELNIERTADCIDELRFFYRNVWLPWDDMNDSEDDTDWCKKHLESRIRFCFDLKRGMSRPMADHVRKLLAEARYIQNKREIMELEMSDDETLEEDKQQVTDLMRMHLRLVEIRNEIEMLENPVLRKIYEDINFNAKVIKNTKNASVDQRPSVYIVTKKATLQKQMEYLEVAKTLIGSDEVVNMLPSLKDCFGVCSARDQIYIPAAFHAVKLLEPLNSNGMIKAILNSDAAKENVSLMDPKAEDVFTKLQDRAVIMSEENDNTLLVFNGDYTIEDVCFDCRNVRLGIWCKNGTVTLKNCLLIGEKSSSTGNGVVVADGASCILENTIVRDFANGITCSGGTLTLKNSTIAKCQVGLELGDGSTIQNASSKITGCFDYGILYKTCVDKVIDGGEKKVILNGCSELQKVAANHPESVKFSGDCAMEGNKKGNIVVINHTKWGALQHSAFLEENFDESGFNNRDDINSREAQMEVSL